MEKQSLASTIMMVIGFIVVGSLLVKILGGILGFALHILIPMALVVWLVRFIFERRNQSHYS